MYLFKKSQHVSIFLAEFQVRTWPAGKKRTIVIEAWYPSSSSFDHVIHSAMKPPTIKISHEIPRFCNLWLAQKFMKRKTKKLSDFYSTTPAVMIQYRCRLRHSLRECSSSKLCMSVSQCVGVCVSYLWLVQNVISLLFKIFVSRCVFLMD